MGYRLERRLAPMSRYVLIRPTCPVGLGPRTKELVDWLVEEEVPAVLFMMGNDAKANPDAMNHVARRSHEVPGGLLIGNHSLTHTTPLPSQGVDGTVHEITEL